MVCWFVFTDFALTNLFGFSIVVLLLLCDCLFDLFCFEFGLFIICCLIIESILAYDWLVIIDLFLFDVLLLVWVYWWCFLILFSFAVLLVF